MDRILEAGFEQPAAENVLIQSRSARVGTRRLRRGDRGRRRQDLEGVGRPERPLAARGRQRGPDLEGRALGARPVRDPRREGQGGRRDRPGPRRRGRRATGPSGLRDRRVRRRERPEGRRDGVRRRPRQGRDALASDHAHRPRDRVRRSRGGRHSAAARADRRLRDVRADRAAEQLPAGRDGGSRDGAPDRARRRRRLLDVLLEARAAGTGCRDEASGRRWKPLPRPPAARC